jgi:hypothetical protein
LMHKVREADLFLIADKFGPDLHLHCLEGKEG